jgi:hypothetical protein
MSAYSHIQLDTSVFRQSKAVAYEDGVAEVHADAELGFPLFGDLLAMERQFAVGAFLIRAGQSAVSGHVGVEDGWESIER